MAFDEKLANRIRMILGPLQKITEKKMFGGIAFMYEGKMSVGIVKEDLMVRVNPLEQEKLLDQPYVRPMDFTGRPMKGFLFVGAKAISTQATLSKWINQSLSYVSSLPEKKPKKGAKGPIKNIMRISFIFLLAYTP